MSERWRILALLFVVRTGMGFQFATIGALGPLVGARFGADAAAVGVLIGLYFVPGIVMALPAGGIARRFGDRRGVVLGLALMAAGGAMMAVDGPWGLQMSGRVLAGIGGVFINVMMTKMVTDWFAGREIASAMAIFVNSWPAGVALALLVQPLVATQAGLAGAQAATAVLALLSLAAILALYRSPPGAGAAIAAPGGAFPARRLLLALVLAALVWGFYNAALAMIFSFGPAILVERGWLLPDASAAISLSIWLVMGSIAVGGVLADRSRWPTAVLLLGLVLMAAAMAAVARPAPSLVLIIMLGAVAGLPAGPIMSLPARALLPATRPLGMGLFYTLYNAIFAGAPWVAGQMILWRGSSGAAMEFGVVALLLAGLGLGLVHAALARSRDA